ncbi:MAG: polyphosphate kinase 2 [Devosia sp.]
MTDRQPFDLENPKLPDWIVDAALESGGYPYAKKLDDDDFAKELETLQRELVKLQAHLQKTGARVIGLFEGRDAAGKGGSIKAYTENLNPRFTLDVALPKPSDRERTQWYFQRYIDWFPAGGEQVLFDRSWYNRAGVELVMGFCTPEQTAHFLEETPRFERMLVRDGIHLFKFWLAIGKETQLKRFHARRHDPLKVWKISPIDLAAVAKWDDYTKAANTMFEATHNDDTPWTVVLANDKRRARLEVIRTVLKGIDYEGKDEGKVGKVDGKIAMAPERYMRDYGKI